MGEFPYPFNWIQVWTIRRKEVQAELGSLLVAPLQMEFGAMILCVVADGHNPPPTDSAGLLKHFQKLPKGFFVEPSGLTAEDKLAIPQTYGGEVADALARRMMIHDGVLGLRGTRMRHRESCC